MLGPQLGYELSRGFQVFSGSNPEGNQPFFTIQVVYMAWCCVASVTSVMVSSLSLLLYFTHSPTVFCVLRALF